MCAYLGNINIEFTIGKIINTILKYQNQNSLFDNKNYNQLLYSDRSRNFIDLFKLRKII